MPNQLVHPDIVKAAWCDDLADEMEAKPKQSIDRGVTIFTGDDHTGWIKYLRQYAKELRSNHGY